MGTTRQNGLWMQWMQNKFAYRYWPFARPALRLRLDSVTRPGKVLHMRLPHAWHVLATACRSPAGRPPCPTAQRLRAEISLPSAAAFVSQAHVAPDGPDAGTRTCGKRWACVATSGFNAKRFCNARQGKGPRGCASRSQRAHGCFRANAAAHGHVWLATAVSVCSRSAFMVDEQEKSTHSGLFSLDCGFKTLI